MSKMSNNKSLLGRVKYTAAALILSASMSLTGCSFFHNDKVNNDIVNEITTEDEIDDVIVDNHDDYTNEDNHKNEEQNTEDNSKDNDKDDNKDDKQEENNDEKDDENKADPRFEIDLSDYTGYSIVEALASHGIDSSFAFRKQLAAYLGINNYKGTAEQNLQMLRLLGANVKENNKDDNDNKDEKHTHSWSKWTSKNDSEEHRTCKTCGKEETRNHTMEEPSVSYTSLNESQHTQTTVTGCSTCDYENVQTLTLSHTYGNWENVGNNKEQRECTGCHHTQTRNISHTHVWGEWHSKNDSLEERSCACGKTETRLHKYGNSTTTYEDRNDNVHVEVTTTTCETCGHVKTKRIVKTHSYGNWIDNGKGQEQRVCSDCGHIEVRNHTMDTPVVTYESLNETQHNKITTTGCKTCDYETVKTLTLSHTYGEWENIGNNKEQRECTGCHHTQTRDISHIHVWGEWYSKNDSLEERACACGETETRSHTYSDPIITYKNINETQHTKVTTSTCSTCGHDKVIEITVDHSYSDWASKNDEVEERACACGHTEERAHEYGAWSNVNGVEQRTCKNCGHVETKNHEHSWSEWTSFDDEKEQRTCSCGAHEERSHEYGDWIISSDHTKETKTCENCGHSIEKTHTHTYGEATTTYEEIANNDTKHTKVVTKTCSRCGEENTTRTEVNHNYGSWVVSSDKTTESRTCADCGHVETKAHIHSYSEWTSVDDDKEERTCSCGEKETRNHEYGVVITTYEDKDGITHTIVKTQTCSNCGHEKVEKETVSHGFSDWTYKNAELEERSCACGKTETRSHDYGTPVVTYEDITDTQHTKKTTTHCSGCGHDEVQTVTVNHSFSDWEYYSDTQEKRTCDCGKTEYRSHTYSEWTSLNDDKEERTCSTCNHTETRNHTYGTPIITYENITDTQHTKKTKTHCSECGHDKVETETVSHSYGDYEYYNQNYDSRTCDCGHVDYVAHDITNPTVTYITDSDSSHIKRTTGTCSHCGHTITIDENLTHTSDGITHYTDDKSQTYNICTDCGEKINVHVHSHEYGTWTDNGSNEIRTCDCGNTETRDHDMNLTYTYDSTTNEDVYTCKNCSHEERVVDTQDRHTSTYEDYVIVGSKDICKKKVKKCSVCNEIQEVVEEIGHGDNLTITYDYEEDGTNKIIYGEIRECSECGYYEEIEYSEPVVEPLVQPTSLLSMSLYSAAPLKSSNNEEIKEETNSSENNGEETPIENTPKTNEENKEIEEISVESTPEENEEPEEEKGFSLKLTY